MNKGEFRKKYLEDSTYESPYLVQRLRKPSKSLPGQLRVDQVFAFGGGGSGLSDKAWELLKPCFEFDYMGAAEFEFGALPKSLDPFSKSKLTKFDFFIEPIHIKPNDSRHWAKKGEVPPPNTKGGTVYVLCREKDVAFVTDAILLYAQNELNTKEYVGLNRSLDPVRPNDSDICGWYELSNGFFFFTDRGMWERTCELFGV